MFDRNTKHLDTDIIKEMKNEESPSTEFIVPLIDIVDGIMYVTDGSKCVVLTFPGKDTSMMAEDDQEEFAGDTSKVIAGITSESFQIQYIPEKINSEANLNFCRNRLDEMEKKSYNANISSDEKESLKTRIHLLQNGVLPKVQGQAISAKSKQGNTYIWLKFHVRSEVEIKNDVLGMIKRINNITGRQCEWIQSKEVILNLLENWITCSMPLNHRNYDPKFLIPDFMAKKGGR